MTSKFSHCGQLVKQHDPDRFLLSMVAVPADRREAVWALFAFNHEIAKTREVVSETQLGLIRLQWWRDVIGQIYEGVEPEGNEIITALAAAIRAHDLLQDLFEALLYAREFDLEDVLPGNLEGVLNYCDFTHTPLLRLVLRVLGAGPETAPVQPIATGYALIGLLRAVPFHAGQRRCYLPEDLLKAHGVRLNNLYEFKPGEGLLAVIEAVSEAIMTDVAPEEKFLKYMQRLTKIYLRQLRACKYDVFAPKMALSPPFKEIRLFLPSM